MASSSFHSGIADPAIVRASDGERTKKVEDISIALVREYLSRKVREIKYIIIICVYTCTYPLSFIVGIQVNIISTGY